MELLGSATLLSVGAAAAAAAAVDEVADELRHGKWEHEPVCTTSSRIRLKSAGNGLAAASFGDSNFVPLVGVCFGVVAIDPLLFSSPKDFSTIRCCCRVCSAPLL